MDPSKKGCGVGTKVMEAIIASRQLRRIKRFTLATADATEFYKKLGFSESKLNYLVWEQEEV
ncbi:hypothetical protein GL2_25480 [Microbulbifer sp. GL-2]|nr:hypothetical protein GL2_25480 [Microbulbifer sp. GL-2]